MSTSNPTKTPANPIVFFDGVCGLCNGFVDWAMPRDKKRRLRFATLQGTTAKEWLRPPYENAATELRSILLLDEKGFHEKSDAVFRVLKNLGGVWSLGLVFWLVPRPLRDIVYDFVAKNRYQWFGKHDSCRLPTREERAFFLD